MNISSFRQTIRLFPGILLGLIVVCIQVLSAFGLEGIVYQIYSKGIYKYLRIIYDFTLGWLPFPFVYVVFLFLLFLIFSVVKSFLTNKKDKGTKRAFTHALASITNFIGYVYFLFYFSWAFNYSRPDIGTQLGLPEVKVDSTILMDEILYTAQLMTKERTGLTVDTNAFRKNIDWTTLEDTIRHLQEGLLKEWGDTPNGRVRIRALQPKGTLLSFSTAGVYIPFAFEGHVDGGLHSLQWPFTLAHEMAHGYGYTDEGVCNFIGLITCMKSSDPYIRYSALLSYWKYMFFEIRHRDKNLASKLYSNLDAGIKADLESIRVEHDKYPDFFPALRDMIYDFYLKYHGVSTGLDSYSEIIVQVQRWKQSPFVFDFAK